MIFCILIFDCKLNKMQNQTFMLRDKIIVKVDGFSIEFAQEITNYRISICKNDVVSENSMS